MPADGGKMKTETLRALYLFGQDYENHGGLRAAVISDYLDNGRETTTDYVAALVEKCRHELGDAVAMAGMPNEGSLRELVSAAVEIRRHYSEIGQPGGWEYRAIDAYVGLRFKEGHNLYTGPGSMDRSYSLVSKLRADRERRAHIDNLDVCIERLSQNPQGIEVNLSELRRFRDELVPTHGPEVSRFLYPSA
jgi:hypothetical protein